MGDQLEKFINANRDEFNLDPAMDPDARWEQIASRLQKNKKSPVPLLWKVAAILFLITTAVLLVDRWTPKEPTLMSNRYEEFQQAEAFYTSLIAEKRTEIAAFSNEQMPEDFMKEVNQLDQLYDELKITFENNVNDDKLMNAMIHNLQLRIEILNQQLKILETLNNVKNEKIHNI